MTMRCAILDDYQNVALKIADWSPLKGKAEITVFDQHLGDPDNVVKALADFYRICLGSAHERIRLGDELRHASSYLTIQKIRYSDVVESFIEASPEDMALMVPSMILQPLIENAIYHGLKGGSHLGTIIIRENQDGDDLFIEVRDDGRGMLDEEIEALNASLRAGERENHGVGNVHRRIELICGPEYGLSYSKNADGGICAVIHLPAVDADSKP